MQTNLEFQQNHNQNLLIVDDDPACIFLAEKILKKYYNTHTVTNGQDALDAIEKNNYDIILMDINLNNFSMDGIKTMRMIKNQRKHRYTKILAVTASACNKDLYTKQGFDGHFIKPLIEKDIIEEINKCMKHSFVYT